MIEMQLHISQYAYHDTFMIMLEMHKIVMNVL